jgi:hypothetical protein
VSNNDHDPICGEWGAIKINQIYNAMSPMPRLYCILHTTFLMQDLQPYPIYIRQPTTPLQLNQALNPPNTPIFHNSYHFEFNFCSKCPKDFNQFHLPIYSQD